MNRKLVFATALFVIVLGLILITPKWVTGEKGQVAQTSQTIQVTQGAMSSQNCGGMMNGDWMNGGMMGGGMMHEDMQLVHQLFANHNQIRRKVEEIPGGIQAVTESDNPQVAALIKRHVSSMYQRVADGRNFSMMSRTLPIMFQNANRYQRQLKSTPKGVVITEKSNAPNMVAVIREHGREVSDFVAKGMSAMCGMM